MSFRTNINWTRDAATLATERWTKQMRFATRSEVLFRMFSHRPPEDQSKYQGDDDTILFVPVPTTITGAIADDMAPSQEWPVDWFRVSYTSEEYAGTHKFSRKAQILSMVDIEKIIREGFAEYMRLNLENAAATAFKSTGIICGASAAGIENVEFKYDGLSTGFTGNMDTNLTHEIVLGIVNRMKRDRVKKWPDGKYRCILSELAWQSLVTDSTFTQNMQYAYQGSKDAFPMIAGAYQGELPYLNVKFYQCDNDDLLSSDTLGGAEVGHALFFGDQPIIEKIKDSERIIATPDPFETLRHIHIKSDYLGGFRVNQPIPNEVVANPCTTRAEMIGLGRVYYFKGGSA